MYQVSRLKNSLTVLTAEMPHMASASLGIWVGVGGRYEPATLNGVSHFIEHMLFKGTRRRNARQISEAVEGLGGYLNAFTGEENTCFYAKARHDHLPGLFDVLQDMFLESQFDPAEIDKERDVIKEELAMYLDQPSHHVEELLNETMWPDHPLGRSLTGTEESLDGLGQAEMLRFRSENYVTPATLIAAAGHVDHRKLVKLVERGSKRFIPGRRPTFDPYREPQTRPRVLLHPKTTAQAQLALGVRVCSRHHEHRFPLRMLNAILGENMSSRLFQVLREDAGLAYSVHSNLDFFDDVGALTIAAGVDSDKLIESVRLIVRELRRLAERPPGVGELRRARDYLIGQIDLHLENTENQMMWIGEQWLAYGRIVSAYDVKQRLAEVTASQVRAVAKEYFTGDRLSLAVVSPTKRAPKLIQLLAI